MARKPMNVFSLSLLDAMTCGLGAVILVFTTLSTNLNLQREEALENVSSEVDLTALKVEIAEEQLLGLKEVLALLIDQWSLLKDRREEIVTEIRSIGDEADAIDAERSEREENIARLRAELEELEAETERLAEDQAEQIAGNRLRSFTGDGNRQYLTGLRMGGQRVVILVDASTSMLARTVVNIFRRRNMSEEQQIMSSKWRQVVDTVDWLTTQIQPGTQIQIFAFNDTAWSLLEGDGTQWHTVVDGGQLDEAVTKLGATVPQGPTSLQAAFAAMRPLDPRPDNIYLLVDGLPTMGEVPPNRPSVTGDERLRHFERAERTLPFNVPVNIILYAMEGDPFAAPAFWRMALNTGGSMMAPSEDWP